MSVEVVTRQSEGTTLVALSGAAGRADAELLEQVGFDLRARMNGSGLLIDLSDLVLIDAPAFHALIRPLRGTNTVLVCRRRSARTLLARWGIDLPVCHSFGQAIARLGTSPPDEQTS